MTPIEKRGNSDGVGSPFNWANNRSALSLTDGNRWSIGDVRSDGVCSTKTGREEPTLSSRLFASFSSVNTRIYGSGSDWIRVAVAVAAPEKSSVPSGAKMSTWAGPYHVSPDLFKMTV